MSRASRTVRDAVKADSFLPVKQPDGSRKQVRGIERIADLIQAKMEVPCLSRVFGPDHILVPVPRSAPLSQTGALWPGRRICEALVNVGLGADVATVLVRSKAVQKSATAAPGQRPDPHVHQQSTKVAVKNATTFTGRKITLVDDFITRGSTLLGMYANVQEAFPNHKVFCFALVRTMSSGDVDRIIAPVTGTIFFTGGFLRREP